MPASEQPVHPSDPYDLQRFIHAQQQVYPNVLAELRAGQKSTHWMWFIFPQIDGLGYSLTTRLYSIKSMAEARAYMAHPVLGPRLEECSELLLAIHDRTASQIFGFPDEMKLQSCMTLFEQAAGKGGVFARVLEQYYHSDRDRRTLEILRELDRSTASTGG